MNSISWFIYVSDVVGSLKPVFGIGGFVAVIASGGCVMWATIEERSEGFVWAKRILLHYALPAILVACIIPSQTTMYAIAASQVGERVAQNETVQGIAGDATKALQIWIKKQIEPQEKK